MNEAEPPATWRQRLQGLRTRARSLMVFGLGVAAAFAALLLYRVAFPPPHQVTTAEMNDSVAQALASATPLPAYSASVYQLIRPSLILIQADAPGADGQSEHGLGSGVIISDQGDILTSLHVVAGATTIELTFADGTTSSAEVIAEQPEHDIAVLRASRPPAQIVPAVLGNPNAMNIGDEAYAVGHPVGLYGSMSSGVISGFNRSFRPENSKQEIEDLIQIDAAVNPGNSGGPLLNRAGEVVGIVTGLVNPSEQNFFVGVGFAVPITIAGGAAGAPPYEGGIPLPPYALS